MTAQTRRAALGALASVPVLALPAVAAAEAIDAPASLRSLRRVVRGREQGRMRGACEGGYALGEGNPKLPRDGATRREYAGKKHGRCAG
jgi:hypothetical protein